MRVGREAGSFSAISENPIKMVPIEWTTLADNGTINPHAAIETARDKKTKGKKMKLNRSEENWLETIVGLIDRAEDAAGLDSGETERSDYQDCADQVESDVLSDLAGANVDYETSYSQSVGSFVIVQSGTEEEKEAFSNALEKAKKAAYPQILEKAKKFAAEVAERAANDDVEGDE